MTYIWINPVTDKMYDTDELNGFLSRHGYKRFYTSGDWLTIVKEKYRLAIMQSSHPVMDVRCPKVKELLSEMDISSDITIPEILPILIHCGIEGGEREALCNEEKIITTPCQSLADMGNTLNLKNTKFIPWNQFVELMGDEPLRTMPKQSPIPPGFFDGLGLKTVSLTGEEEIRAYFKENEFDEAQVVEMLFCKDGCHNGDGIRKYENER